MNRFWYSIQKHIFRFIGDIKWSGWKNPFWFTINAAGYQLRGEDYRNLIKQIKPGDIVIRRFEGYIDKFFIPGFWNHAGIYVDGDMEQVVHAISDGVLIEDILNFMRTDHMIVLRPPADMVESAIAKAKSIVGLEYDFEFNFTGHKRFSCTEVVDYCYPKMITPKKRFGKTTIVADDIVTCNKFESIWDSRALP